MRVCVCGTQSTESESTGENLAREGGWPCEKELIKVTFVGDA